jgi:hypothetical protein
MPRPEAESPTRAVWCGRSWEGLARRRYEAFRHAVALRNAKVGNSNKIVTEFLAFFGATGIGLFRDEEEWIFRSLSPTPSIVFEALEGHIEISALIEGLLSEAQAGVVDLRVVHRLGELLQTHLLLEEDEVRPLVRGGPRLLPAS